MQLLFLNTWHASLKSSLTDFLSRQSQSADVICLQESEEHVRELCRAALTDFQELSADKDLPNGNTFGQAMYIRPGITITGSGVLFQNEPDTGIALHASLKREATHIEVCNMHGISYHKVDDKLDSPARLKTSATLIDYFRETTLPVIIGGDFNMSPQAKSIQVFSMAGYRDLIREYQVPTTRNHYVWDRYPKTPQYFADYLFTSPGLEVESFQVLPDLVSDHQPLLLQVTSPVPVAAAPRVPTYDS